MTTFPLWIVTANNVVPANTFRAVRRSDIIKHCLFFSQKSILVGFYIIEVCCGFLTFLSELGMLEYDLLLFGTE